LFVSAETPEGAQLKRMLDKVDEMRTQRRLLMDTLSKELNDDDISKKLLANRDIDNQVL
jgi:hypothetical protein